MYMFCRFECVVVVFVAGGIRMESVYFGSAIGSVLFMVGGISSGVKKSSCMCSEFG